MLGSCLWVQAVRYDLFSVVFFLLGLSLVIFSLPLLGLCSKSTSLNPGFCVCRPRQYNTICWKLDLLSGYFVSFSMITGDHWMWLVSCRRQGMLTQGSAPDLKCKLNITSFLTLSHPLNCLIYAQDIMIIVLLLQVMGGWRGWGCFFYIMVWVGGQGMGIFFLFLFCFLLLLHGCYMIVCCVCFIVDFFLSLSLVPLIRHY